MMIDSHSPAPAHPPIKDVDPKESTMLGFGFAMDLGYTIAVPAVLFGFGGGYLDKYLGSSPAFLLLGLLFAFVTSFITVWRKVRVILDRMPKVLPKKKVDPVDAETAKEQHDIHELFRPPSE